MKRIITLCLFFAVFFCFSQKDYNNNWQDFFSYNNVKDIVTVNSKIYALSDNAFFTYDMQNQAIEKFSSVNGLSGGTTSSIYYNKTFKRLVIGYESGLIEVVDDDKKVSISPDIVKFNQAGDKRINAIFGYEDKLYLATPFAVVGYDIKKLEFGDTYFIGAGSTAVNAKSITVLNNEIYVATPNGVYVANITNPNLVDASNWKLKYIGDFQKVVSCHSRVFAVSDKKLISLGTVATVIKSFPETIIDLKSSEKNLVVTFKMKAITINENLVNVGENNTDTDLNTATIINNETYLGTKYLGILKGVYHEKILPEGPVSNDVFSIDVYHDNLWVVYGGYSSDYAPMGINKGYSHFNGTSWKNTSVPYNDLSFVTIDRQSENKVFISSMGSTSDQNSTFTGGLLKVDNDEVVNFFNHKNSSLEYISSVYPQTTTIRLNGTAFDHNGDFWVTNIGADHKLQKYTSSGWKSFDINSISNTNAMGMTEIGVDKSNTLWIGSRRGGVLVFNEKGERKMALTTEVTKGNLPNLNVKTIAVDHKDRVWIGTTSGLVMYNDALSIFNKNLYQAKPVIILDNDIPSKLLGDQEITSIVVDGADNKWFGTNSGVLYTNSNGQKTLAQFNKGNSPLPSNKILKISVDDSTGKVYFATDKGIVAYKSNVSSFGEHLGEVYVYPNPVLKTHNEIIIDGRNGTHLPKGTNVKILDVSGDLVYETNVDGGDQVNGGKVVWNKRNIKGNKVASGIYIVLLTTKDNSESSTTKIAIVN